MDFMLIVKAVAVLGIMGAVFGAVLAFAAKIFYVEVDPKQEAVRECLAGANCGGCGYPGCDGYAAAVAAGKAPVNCCVAGGAEAAEKIAAIMGVDEDRKGSRAKPGHTGGKSKVDPSALANAIGMYQSGEHKLSEITAATGISRSTLYRNLPKGGDGDG